MSQTTQKGKYERQVPERKIAAVRELSELIKTKKTLLVASIKNLPASQFQEIVKKLRGKAVVKVPKKSLIFRAIDESGKEGLKKVKEYIEGSVAILFSDIDSFELASELLESKTPAKAKAGQEAPEDIEVQAGPTDLVPGPAISELGALGIQVQIEKGKIHIKEPKVIVKKGEKISELAADIMNKLDIKPFSVGFIPLTAYDIEKDKLYPKIEIDKEKTVEELKTAFSKALAFAVEIGYACKDTIKFLLAKASAHETAIKKLVKETPDSTEQKQEKVEETTKQETTAETEEKQSDKEAAENKPSDSPEGGQEQK